MRRSAQDLKKAFIAISFGLDPVIFAIVGWYAAPHLNLDSMTGALIGAIIGFGMMFWRIWKFGLAVELKAKYEVESEDLRSLITLIDNERYKIIDRQSLMKIIGTHGPLQLLNVLKSISLVDRDFYSIDKMDEVVNGLVDFSKVIMEIRLRSPMEFLTVLDTFNDFIMLLCANFAFKYEVHHEEWAQGFIVPTTKVKGAPGEYLSMNLRDYLANRELRELYPKALNEALMFNSRSTILVLTCYSLLLMANNLERLSYGRNYSEEIREVAKRIYAIAVNDLKGRYRKSEVLGLLIKKHKLFDEGSIKEVEELSEEEILKSLVASSYEALMVRGRLPLKAKTVISYLLVKWSEKVSLNLAFMASRGEIDPREAYATLLMPR
ncbi:MAG: hypothetical protein N3F04_02720 [Candidatus Nezhaarchaeota archaeon]|nr:hypothetical protein [Candidatus Nezhaarchaeota archaeon]MCX8141684.1 hypothetical protein [Candidatus Nezhaarchaeota archaeon]MDW8049951.1 hypothetical protein [Nitrososphaerota archaeon]